MFKRAKEKIQDEPLSPEELRRAQLRAAGHENYVERLIREAEEQGKFNNLAGEGKPLHIKEENPYVEEDMRLAYKILENAGCAPPWIETEKAVEELIASVKRERENHLLWLNRQLNHIKNGPTHTFFKDLRQLAASHQHWLKAHAVKLKEVNERIHSFNHICPVPGLFKIPIAVERVVEEYERRCPAIPQV